MRSTWKVLLVLTATLASCRAGPSNGIGDEAAQQVDTAAAATSDSVWQSGSPRADWVVSPSGAGDVRIGMSLSELLPHLAPGTDTAAAASGCAYLPVAGAPDSLGFMVDGRRLVRIDVRGGPTPTAEGARTGDTEGQIAALYPDARRQPHKYTGGSYLIVIPESAPDTLHRYVFETDGSRVTTYRAGVYPPVQYVEGCA